MIGVKRTHPSVYGQQSIRKLVILPFIGNGVRPIADIDEMGEEMNLYTGDEVIDATVIDHDENRQNLLRKNHGIHSQFAYKSAGSVMDGILLIQAALRRAVEGKPGGLYFYDKLLCNSDPNPDAKDLDLIKEMQGLEFDKNKDAPIKEDDDAFDALRYRFLYRAIQDDIDFAIPISKRIKHRW